MKIYIFLATTICNIGGAQRYLLSKTKWLEENDWLVYLFYYQDGQRLLDGFDTDHTYLVKEIEFPTFYYNCFRKKQIIKKLSNLVMSRGLNKDSIIIESTTIGISTWGEYLASFIKAKHIIFSLQEKDLIGNHSLGEFLRFKHLRKEVAGIMNDSVMRMMNSFGSIISQEESYTLSAYSTNPIENYKYPLTEEIRQLDVDFIIGSIGRLDKPFVIPTIDSILEYVKDDENHKYLLLLIGDSPSGSKNRNIIENKAKSVNNLKLYVTGYIYPIPSDLLNLCDIFLSSSGSAYITAEFGVPTVSIDGLDLMPIGVLGYTTKECLFRNNEQVRPVRDYLNDVLKQKKYVKRPPKPIKKIDFWSHLNFIKDSSNIIAYYDIKKLCWNTNQRLQRWLMPFVGPLMFVKAVNCYKYIIRNFYCKKSI